MGYQNTAGSKRYRGWSGKLGLVMRQEHRAGEKTFINYTGQPVDVVVPLAGEVRAPQIFAAVLSASSYTFTEATWTQGLPGWVGAHQRAFQFFGEMAELMVIGNLKSGVSKACLYEPDINQAYQKVAAHYGLSNMPNERRPRSISITTWR
ncbi:hypothetical protein DFAR_2120004 [Desulfarculales bacterium]